MQLALYILCTGEKWHRNAADHSREMQKDDNTRTQFLFTKNTKKMCFNFFLFSTSTLKLLDEKRHGTVHTKMEEWPPERVYCPKSDWVRSWKWESWSKMTVLSQQVFYCPQKYLHKENTVNRRYWPSQPWWSVLLQ